MATRSASRAALLELRNERGVVEDGHRFLDEKRALLAHEVLDRLQGFEGRLATRRAGEQEGARALAEGVTIDGLENLLLYAPIGEIDGDLRQRTRSFLGVTMVTEAKLRQSAGDGGAASGSAVEPAPSPEARRCGEIHRELLGPALELATELGNLVRLMEEFQRTQRRVRALEKVVLPELQAEERAMEEALEEVDQEEAIRVRLAAGRD